MANVEDSRRVANASTFSEAQAQYRERIDERNSIHEAGHAVMALLLGVEVHEVYIEDIRDNSTSERWGLSRCSGNVTEEDEVIICLAGVGAELIHQKTGAWTTMLRHTGRNDWRRVLKLFRECEFTRVERKVIVATAKAEVTTMLTRHWSSVLAVADALRTKRTLTGEETKLLVPKARDEYLNQKTFGQPIGNKLLSDELG